MFEQFKKKQQHKKDLVTLKYVLNRVIHGSTNMLSAYNATVISKIFTGLLQFISFVTTYAGFSFYLKSLNSLAPLFLAVVVQGTAYYCMNYSATQKRVGIAKRRVLLYAMILISMFTSYIGVVNLIIKPMDNLESEYEKYMSDHNEIINRMVVIPDIDDIFAKIDDVLNSAKNLYSSLYSYGESERTSNGGKGTYGEIEKELERRIGDIDKNKPNKSDINNFIEKIKNFDVYNDIEKNRYLEFNAYLKKIISLDDYAYGLKSAYGSGSSSKAKDPMFDTYNKIFEDNYDNKYEYSNISISNEYTELRLADFNTVKLEILTQSPSIESDFDLVDSLFGIPEIIGISLTPPSELTESGIVREQLRKIVEKKYLNLSANLSNKNKADLDEAYKKFNIPSQQELAIKYITNTDTQYDALFSLGIAVLTDGISLLIAWALTNRRRSILYASSISEVTRNKEETLEDFYTYICFNKLYDDTQFKENLKNGNFAEMERSIIHSIHKPLNELVDSIIFCDFMPELNKCGYITYEFINSSSEISSSTDRKLIFAALRDIGMLMPASIKETNQLVVPELTPISFPSDTTKILLVNKNFIQWYTENFAELLMNSTAII